MKLHILLVSLIVSALQLTAATVEVAPDLTVDIPDGFTPADSITKSRIWRSDHGTICIAVAPDTTQYDYDKCFEHLDRIMLPLESFACFDHSTEPFLAWRSDYVEKSYYNLHDKSRMHTHTAYAGGIPYVIAYWHKAEDTDLTPFSHTIDSVNYTGSWWKRLKTLFSQSSGLILLIPVVLCSATGLITLIAPKKVVIPALALLLAIAGLPLWSEWDTAIIVYLIWTAMLTALWILDTREFNELVGKIDKAIP